MIRAVIIDDEPKSISILRLLLTGHFDDVELVGEAGTVPLGVQLIEQEEPDLIFLDIEMGNSDGFALLDHLSDPYFHIIFITAHSSYAVRAFRYAAIDYLLKPVDLTELSQAIDKVRTSMNSGFQVNIPQSRKKKFLDLRKNESEILIDINDIVFLEAQGSYTSIHLSDNKKQLVSVNLKVIENELDESLFMRVHRSYTINLQHVVRVIKRQKLAAEMANGQMIEISRRNRTAFFEKITLLSEGNDRSSKN